MIPMPLAVFGILLTLLQLAWHNFGGSRLPQAGMVAVDGDALPASGEGRPRTERTEGQFGRWGEAGACMMIALLVGLVFAAGIFPAIFVFSAGYLVLSRYCSLLRGTAYAALMTASIYLLFVTGLEMQPYHGLLTGWLF